MQEYQNLEIDRLVVRDHRGKSRGHLYDPLELGRLERQDRPDQAVFREGYDHRGETDVGCELPVQRFTSQDAATGSGRYSPSCREHLTRCGGLPAANSAALTRPGQLGFRDPATP